MERKNPLGTLEAFKRAFGKENDEVGLVIKISGNAKEDMEKIREFFDGYTNIYFMTEMLTKIEVNSLCLYPFIVPKDLGLVWQRQC